jgi:catechol 1,2-dioxygenase
MTTLETRPTTEERLGAIVDDFDEYRIATEWLTAAGQQDFQIPLLLDLFLSTTVDDVEATAPGSTESNVEGPFYLPDMPMLEAPYVLPRRPDEPGDVLVFSGTVTATDGTPLAGALVDVWQDNGIGEYSHFHPGVPEHNLRGRLLTDAEGRFELETILPVAYSIPTDGAVGQLLAALGRDAFRPAHVHFKVTHETASPLTTQIYFAGDRWLDDDVVVGAVKPELVTTVVWDGDRAACAYDFVLGPA